MASPATVGADATGFANPWEHVRLLSDGDRNEAMLALLARRAPGARVLEVGCGAGLLSCAAARLGARHVYAVEPTPMAAIARQMVRDNGLEGVVEVLEGRVEDLEPRPVDLAFSELLNADPFVEGVLDAMDGAASWCALRGEVLSPGEGLSPSPLRGEGARRAGEGAPPWLAADPRSLRGGTLAPPGLAPRRLRVWSALARASGSAQEARAAARQIRTFGARYGLELGCLGDVLAPGVPYVSLTSSEAPVGPPTLVWDIALGTGERPEARTLALAVDEAGPVGGVLSWFEAELDDGVWMANPPGAGGHWGQHLASFAEERGLRARGTIDVHFSVISGKLSVRW
jgi:SAM-dependent methyltransferase